MPDPFKRIRSGDPIALSAEAMNEFARAAIARKRTQFTTAGRPLHNPVRGDVVLIKNDSGADLGRFEVLGVTGVIIDPADNEDAFAERPLLVGQAPTTGASKGKFVVLLEPIADGRVGRAMASGVTIAKVNVADADDEFADVADGDTSSLASGADGAAAILWKEDGTGTVYAVVRIGAGAGGEGSAVDLKNNGTTAVTGATFINLPTTYNTNDILEFAANGDGGDLRFKGATGTYKVLLWNGSSVVWDYPRAHA